MKTCVLSESEADEAAIRVLIDALFGEPTEFVAPRPIRGRGVQAILAVFAPVVMYLHYRTEAEALAIVVDSNHGSVHSDAHDSAGAADPGCRLCLLRKSASDVRAKLRPVPNREKLKIAIGLAVPAIEAWYLCGRNKQVSEAAWCNGMKMGRFPYSKIELKAELYGAERIPLETEIRIATEEAQRIIAKASTLELLQSNFPGGFGPFARDVRAWRLS
jgi:hypothetical protein